jgi:DNA-binding phage protein
MSLPDNRTLLGAHLLRMGVSPSEFAASSGISRAVVYRLLSQESPTAQVRTLLIVHDTTGIPLEALAREWTGLDKESDDGGPAARASG